MWTLFFNLPVSPIGSGKKSYPPLMANVVQVAKQQSAKLAIVDNIYAYGRSKGEKVKETFVKNPHTKKGKIRLQIETKIKDSGVPAMIAHFPDFYGPNAENTLLHYTLQNVVKDKKLYVCWQAKNCKGIYFYS